MAFLPTIIGIEDAAGARIDAKRPDGTRGPIMLRLASGFVGVSEVDGGVTRVTIDRVTQVFEGGLVDDDLEVTGTLTASDVDVQGTLDVQTAMGASGILTPAAIATTENNWSPTGLSTAQMVRVNPASGASVISGIVAPTFNQFLWIINIHGTNTVTLPHLSGSSTAANQFMAEGGANRVIGSTGASLVWYDLASSRWRVLR